MTGLNLQFQSTGCPVSVPNTNPLLDGRFLEDNGGPTLTIALLPGSPAINAIAIGDCVDQDNQPVKTSRAASAVPTRQTPVIAISGRTSSEPRPESRSEPAGQPCGARDWRPHRALGYCGSRRVRAAQPATRGLKSAEQFNAFNPHYIPTANRGPKKDAQRWTVFVRIRWHGWLRDCLTLCEFQGGISSTSPMSSPGCCPNLRVRVLV